MFPIQTTAGQDILVRIRTPQNDAPDTKRQRLSPRPSQSPHSSDSFSKSAARKSRPASLTPTAPEPLTVAKRMFKNCKLSPELRQLVQLHLSKIPASQVLAYSGALQNFTASAQSRMYPLVISQTLLSEVISNQDVDHLQLVPMALQFCHPKSDPQERRKLFRAIAPWPQRLLDLRPLIAASLQEMPNQALRYEALLRLPQWDQKFARNLEDYLHCLEPLWPLLERKDFASLDKWFDVAEVDDASETDASAEEVQAYSLCELGGLDAEEIEALAQRHESLADRDYWVRYDEDHENVMKAPRHFATHAAVRTIADKVTSKVPDGAVVSIINLFVNKIEASPALGNTLGLTDIFRKRAIKTWSAPRVRIRYQYDEIGPLMSNATLAYLGDHKMPVSRFVALVWQAIHSYRDDDKPWGAAATSRAAMREGFVKALARLQLATDEVQARYSESETFVHKDVPTRRRCQVAVTQELMTTLAGFYPFSIDYVTPQDLLSTLAEDAFGQDGEQDKPDVARLLSFVENAQKRVKDIFGTEPDPEVGQQSNTQIFNEHLRNYLAYNYDFVISEVEQDLFKGQREV